MVLAIFVGGIFPGNFFGLRDHGAAGRRGLRFQSEEAQAMGSNLTCAYSPTRKFSPSLGARPQASGAWFTPGP